MGNIKIGRNCVIAANSVVKYDVPDYCIVEGSPAKIIKLFNIDNGKWINVKSEEEVDTLIRKRKDLLDLCSTNN